MAVLTRIYDDVATAERARASLDSLGWSDVEVSVLGNDRMREHYGSLDAAPRDLSGTATGAGIGAVAGGGAGLLAGLGMLAIPGIGPLVAAGWLAATAVGAAGGAAVGGTIGALADIGISEADAPVFHEAMQRGNVALTVRFPEERRAEVTAALAKVPEVGIGDLRSRFEGGGWRYDEAEAERQARLRDHDPSRLPPL